MDAPPKPVSPNAPARDLEAATARTMLSTPASPPERDVVESDIYARTVVTHGNVTASLPDERAISDPAERYEPGLLLGSGGMGEVRLVKDKRIGRAVARKTLHPGAAAGSSDAWKRFVREARVQGQLEHPAVVPVYDFATTEGGELCFTMRRVQGVTLEKVLEQLASGDADAHAKYSRRKLLTAFVSVCLAVHYAHTRGVFHRDLKPANLMLGEFGEVYVLDWGVAKLTTSGDVGIDTAGAHDPGDDTEQGALIGTPAYMSPEQLLGKSDRIDARSDVYALGLILYELLTHKRFHAGRGFASIAAATLEGIRAQPSLAGADVPPELDAACVRAAALEPADRFASARELANAVERFLDGDRDLARRKELAAEHAATAAAAREQGEAGRDTAMRNVVASLALDPAQPDARRTLVELLVHQPEQIPPAAEAEFDRQMQDTRRVGLRLGLLGLLSFLACVPYVLWIGVKSWAAMGPAIAMLFVSTGYAAFNLRRSVMSSTATITLVALICIAVGFFSSWLGPFVLLPGACIAVAMLGAAFCSVRERWAVLGLTVLAASVPWALEGLGLVPRSFAFVGDTLVLYARGVHLPPALTVAGLIYTSVIGVAMSVFLLGRLRDALRVAERRLFLQAWQLRRMLDVA